MALNRVCSSFAQNVLHLLLRLLVVVSVVTALTVQNLPKRVTWPADTQSNVRLARNARLNDNTSDGPATLTSLKVASNFTSRSWTLDPFTNRTCSSQVEPYSRIAACTHIAERPLLDAKTFVVPADAALLQALPSRNDTSVVTLTNGRRVELNATTNGSGSAQLTFISWIWLAQATGVGDAKILSKIALQSQGGSEIYSLATGSNGRTIVLTYQSRGVLSSIYFLLEAAGLVDFRKPAWHHLAVVVDGQTFPRAYVDGLLLASINDRVNVSYLPMSAGLGMGF